MDVPVMSYYKPHERVFVNSRKRSNSAIPMKSNTISEFGRSLTPNGFRQHNVHASKQNSNYLLGSSIVNVNFVNNVSNLNRGFDGFRNAPLINYPSYHRSNLTNNEARTLIRQYGTIRDDSNTKILNNPYPFENYTYKNNTPVYPVVNKRTLNNEDRIISNNSNPSSRSGEVSENNKNSVPILTKNYISGSIVDVETPKEKPKTHSKSKEKFCVLNNSPDLKRSERKNKLNKFLDKIKNENENLANSQKSFKINIGKPTHVFVAKFGEPVEKELESWHNSHNSTLKWERVKHGLYSVDGSIVHLLKLNGCLYVEGHGFKKHKGKMTILKFVEEKESKLLREKS
ncbi:hypothetical protein MACK_000905 [Theileria orientalis]|uniref:Uncharacterized protein n=1 Tax=Theileria orientalis TaxID=68886 RepID=A0A976MAP3_THEOR|nr:hypothetical protein MACK_000905 [Theileria orientalis]